MCGRLWFVLLPVTVVRGRDGEEEGGVEKGTEREMAGRGERKGRMEGVIERGEGNSRKERGQKEGTG